MIYNHKDVRIFNRFITNDILYSIDRIKNQENAIVHN